MLRIESLMNKTLEIYSVSSIILLESDFYTGLAWWIWHFEVKQ